MSILPAIMQTLYNDAYALENNVVSQVIHGDSQVNPKQVGLAQGFSFMRAFLGAVGNYLNDNPNVTPGDLPSTFHPEKNETIKNLMFPSTDTSNADNSNDPQDPAPAAESPVVETTDAPADAAAA